MQRLTLGSDMWRAVFTAVAIFVWSCPAEAAPETCSGFKSCSRAFTAHGVCSGLDDLPILEPAWEDQPITITSVTIGLRLWDSRGGATGTLFAGNSYVPDVMALQIGPGATTRSFGPREVFTLPGKPPSPHYHVDLHMDCTQGASYEAWLIVYYTLP